MNTVSENQSITQPALLEMRNVTKRYSGVTVLKDLNMKINPGEVLALVGENGAGKSTLIKILSGAIQKNAGQILINGEEVEFSTPFDAEKHEIVTVYQEFNLFSYLSVAENLFFNRYPMAKGLIDWRSIRYQAEELLNKFDLNLPVDKKVSELSIAEKQMLEIAKAIYRDARILILDEPTAVLGGADVERLLDIVHSLKKHGMAVIFISHRLKEIFGLADSYLVLKDGKQVSSGSIEETNPDDLVSKMVGRALSNKSPKDYSLRTNQELLRIEGVSRKGVLHDINLTLHKGEVLGIAGLRGAGRTELAKAIFGADPIDAGKIYVEGREVKLDSPRAAIEEGIGLVPEDRRGQGLFQNLSSFHNIFMASIKNKIIHRKKELAVAVHYVESLAVKLPNLDLVVGGLSGGNQQKIVFAKWLEAGVRVLILDEPTRGIDVGSKVHIYKVVEQLCKKGFGVILISSELPEVLEMSDRILVMYKGKITGELDGKTATEEAVMKFAVGGE